MTNPPLHLQGGGPHEVRWRGFCRRRGPSTMLRMVPLPFENEGRIYLAFAASAAFASAYSSISRAT